MDNQQREIKINQQVVTDSLLNKLRDSEYRNAQYEGVIESLSSTITELEKTISELKAEK